jgi:4-hydroxyphenylpyruvate dioxygenase
VSVLGFCHLEFWVRDSGATAALLHEQFGFSVSAALEETGGLARPPAYELRQGEITFLIREPTPDRSDVADFVQRHGDGVADVAFWVDDAAVMNRGAVAAGATTVTGRGGHPSHVLAGFGDCVHTLLERSGPASPTPPWLDRNDEPRSSEGPSVNLLSIDHCAVSVEAGQRERWARFYEEALGLVRIPGDRIVYVDGSAFTMSTVQVPEGDAALVLAEPTMAAHKSQIADYLEQFQGSGVHHIALATRDIEQTVTALHSRGVRMLDVPASYLATADARLDGIDVGADWRDLARFGVLVDWDEDGYLLQAFTPPIGDRPTTCFEIIQREGTRGFGAHNVRDLYSQVVREQQRRERSQA